MFDMISCHASGLTRQEEMDITRHGQYSGGFFIMLLRNFPSKGFGKLNVCLSEKLPSGMDVRLFPGNVCLSIIKNFTRKDEYFSSDSRTKCLILLDEIIGTLEFAAGYYSWDMTELNKAYALCKELNLEYEFLYGPAKSSPNRKYKACVGGFMSPALCRALMIITEAKTGNAIKRMPIQDIKQSHRDFLFSIFGKRRWLNNNEYSLIESGGGKEYVMSIDSDVLKLIEHEQDERKLLTAAFSSPRPALMNHPADLTPEKISEYRRFTPIPEEDKLTIHETALEVNWEEKDLSPWMNRIPKPVPLRHLLVMEKFLKNSERHKITEIGSVDDGIYLRIKSDTDIQSSDPFNRGMEYWLRKIEVYRGKEINLSDYEFGAGSELPQEKRIFSSVNFADPESAVELLRGLVDGQVIENVSISKDDFSLRCFLDNGMFLYSGPCPASAENSWRLLNRDLRHIGSLTVGKRKIWFNTPLDELVHETPKIS